MIQSQRTEVPGRWPVPSGWKWYSLSDVIAGGVPEVGNARATESLTLRNAKEIRTGKPEIQTSDSLINDAGTIPVVSPGDLHNTKEIRPSNRIMQKDAALFFRRFTGRKLLTAGPMGKVGILDKSQTVAIDNVIQVITPDEELLSLDFLFYYFLLQQTRTYLQKDLGLNLLNSNPISPEAMATAKIVIPPLHEQQRIVARIEALTHDIEKCRRLLYAQREDALTALEQVLRDTLSAALIKRWSEMVPIGTLLKLVEHKHKAGNDVYKNYPYIQANNIEPFTGRLLDLKTVQKSGLPENRIIYILENALGTILYAPNIESRQSERVSIIQSNEVTCHVGLFPLAMHQQKPLRVLQDFIYWSFLARTPMVANTGMRLGDVKVTKEHLFNSSLPIPSNMHEQTAIVNHLNSVRDMICKICSKQDEEQQRLDQMEENILEKAFRGLL